MESKVWGGKRMVDVGLLKLIVIWNHKNTDLQWLDFGLTFGGRYIFCWCFLYQVVLSIEESVVFVLV